MTQPVASRDTRVVTNSRTPVLVGVGQASDRGSPPQSAGSPLDLMTRAAAAALADANATGIALDTVAVVRLFANSSAAFASPFGAYTNLPRSLARRLGHAPATELYGPVGGNTPQMLVNLMAERIARGEADAVLIAGGEALRTQANAAKAGIALAWGDAQDGEPGGEPATLGPETPLVSGHEIAHGIALPVHVYPLFESALAARIDISPAATRARIGALMAPFTRVAAANPHAMVPVARTADELVTATDANRMIASPYTKYLVSNLFVDQAAAVVMLSTAAADAAGVPRDQARLPPRLRRHPRADPRQRAQRLCRLAVDPGRRGVTRWPWPASASPTSNAIDLYSCFPVAVAIAAREIGLADDDPRGLTLTGGLPYFGGAGKQLQPPRHRRGGRAARARRPAAIASSSPTAAT